MFDMFEERTWFYKQYEVFPEEYNKVIDTYFKKGPDPDVVGLVWAIYHDATDEQIRKLYQLRHDSNENLFTEIVRRKLVLICDPMIEDSVRHLIDYFIRRFEEEKAK